MESWLLVRFWLMIAIGTVYASTVATHAIGQTTASGVNVDVITGGTLAGLVALVFWIEWKLREAAKQTRADMVSDFAIRERALLAHVKQLEELLEAAHARARRYEIDSGHHKQVPSGLPPTGQQPATSAPGPESGQPSA